MWLLLTLTATLPGLSLTLFPSTEERTKSSCLRLRIQFALWAAGLLCDLGRLCPTWQVGLPQRDLNSGIPTPILLALISGLQPQSPGLSILPQLFLPHGQLFGGTARPAPPPPGLCSWQLCHPGLWSGGGPWHQGKLAETGINEVETQGIQENPRSHFTAHCSRLGGQGFLGRGGLRF